MKALDGKPTILESVFAQECDMETKPGWMILPLLCVAGIAMAQDMEKDNRVEPAEPVAARVQVQAQEKTTATRVKRQGGDMRHCLDKKRTQAIIRCAEPGRKP
jgi:hypothetical protein